MSTINLHMRHYLSCSSLNHKRKSLLIFISIFFVLLISSSLASAQTTISNRFRPAQFLAIQNNVPVITTGLFEWEVENLPIFDPRTLKLDLFVRLKIKGTSNYLHMENKKLEAGPIQPGWHSAMWILEKVETYNRIKNRYTGDYLHTETGKLEAGKVPPGYFTAMWLFSQSFNMIIFSDPQYPWTAWQDNGVNKTETEVADSAVKVNINHVNSMNRLIDELGAATVKGAIINGDLTAFGHDKELSKFLELYKPLKTTKYMGLGNHDYANNVDDCYQNNCANRMVEFMRDEVRKIPGVSFDYAQPGDYYEGAEIRRKHEGSLAYSWDIGNIHFVQLQNYPSYKKEWNSYVSGSAIRKYFIIKSSLNWLKHDLAKARNAGKVIIVNMHDSDHHWGDGYTYEENYANFTAFKNMLEEYKVSAVFAGHYHGKLGKNSSDKSSNKNYLPSYYGNTPLYYCGSASQSKYLLVRFENDTKMIVTEISSLGGKVTRSTQQTETLYAGKPATPHPLPGLDGFVTFFNEGGYVARYTMRYTLNGTDQESNTGNMSLGNKIKYDIPVGAINIYVKGEVATGLVWEPWRKIFETTFASSPNRCFKTYGTTLAAKWNNDCQ